MRISGALAVAALLAGASGAAAAPSRCVECHLAIVSAVAAFHAFDLPRMAAALDAARRDADAVRGELER